MGTRHSRMAEGSYWPEGWQPRRQLSYICSRTDSANPSTGIYFRRDLDLLGASIMQGGAIVRSRKTTTIKNAPMLLLSFTGLSY